MKFVVRDLLPKRRWFQFSLKTMLVVISLVSLPLTWLAYERNAVRKRENAIAAIEKCGGRLEFDDSCHSRPAWLRPLLSDNSTGEAVFLSFTDTGVTDADLAYVAHLPQLKILYLSRTNVTDVGMTHLVGLSKLERLYLNRTKVKDAGLRPLSLMQELKVLDLAESPVTDAGLVQLSRAPTLELLYVKGTQVTDEGVAELEKALPRIEILR